MLTQNILVCYFFVCPFESHEWKVKEIKSKKFHRFMLLLGRIIKAHERKWTRRIKKRKKKIFGSLGRWAPSKCFAKRWTKHNVLENKNAGGKGENETKESERQECWKKNFIHSFQSYIKIKRKCRKFHVTKLMNYPLSNEKLKALWVSIKVD